MSKYLALFFLIAAPSLVAAQDFHQGGFFDTDVSSKGFFTDEQAGIPIKNNTGVITRKGKTDSWEVPPDKVASIVTAEAKAASEKQVAEEQAKSQERGDSFEVRKEPTD